ncbi:TPA_asm: hypothetical protein G4D26_004850, partial [Salmonella enterica subsp. enterica serovar 4,[5],12:b:-]|nr:hypothetical protein [Salmonella enterica subsp. enterica serovar 4,[5],12:b:-]
MPHYGQSYQLSTGVVKKPTFSVGLFIKGREVVNSPPLITFPPSSIDEIADQ